MSTNISNTPPLFRAARIVFEAITERPMARGELDDFLLGGDFSRALGDPVTFQRLESRALKAGELAQAATWRAIGEAVEEDELDPLIFDRVLAAAVAPSELNTPALNAGDHPAPTTQDRIGDNP